MIMEQTIELAYHHVLTLRRWVIVIARSDRDELLDVALGRSLQMFDNELDCIRIVNKIDELRNEDPKVANFLYPCLQHLDVLYVKEMDA